MKILGGFLRGRNFYMPEGIRPTQDRTRKAIFDIVGQDLQGLDFLDLFAGSGAVGLEALSRGARRVVFVEKEMRYADVISKNITTLNIESYKNGVYCSDVIGTDVFFAMKQLNKKKERFDIIFLDPPYGMELA